MKTERVSLIITLLIAFLFFLTSSISAQKRQGKHPPQMPDETQIVEMVEDLSSQLSLNESQKTKILALYKEHFSEAESAMSSGQRPNREEMESLRSEFEDNIKSMLNAEQQELYDEYLENNKPHRGQDKQGRSNRRR